MIRRCLSLLIAISTIAVGVSVPSMVHAAPGAAQRRGQPAAEQPAAVAVSPQNRQVLAKDMSQQQVVEVMQTISASLGVQCGYCHMPAAAAPEAAGRGRGRGARGGAAALDFASDEKPQKKLARQMMLMVRDINPRIETAAGKPSGATARVGCVTCHRGVAIPRQLFDILDQTAKDKGLPAAVAQYSELRKQYFGAQAYDFSETSLVAYAQRATQANRPDEALSWLRLNLEYYPLSAQTYAGLSQAQLKKNDKETATKSQEKAVELEPQNAQFKRQLDQLKGQGQ